jgi:hypothetical protein
MQDELLFLQRQMQIFFELSPVAGGLVHARGKKLHVVAPGRFGVIHRRIGIAHENIDAFPVAGEYGDADARGGVQTLSVDVIGLRQGPEDLSGDSFGGHRRQRRSGRRRTRHRPGGPRHRFRARSRINRETSSSSASPTW